MIALSLLLIAYAISKIKSDSDTAVDTGDSYTYSPDTQTETQMAQTWTPPASKYLRAIYDAEIKYNIPHNLLARQLWQESRFNANAYNSKSDARGIAQIVPKWHPDVNPLDAYASIDYAGKYMHALYKKYASWDMALAAYNWGMGNLDKYGFANAPSETRNYVADITGDVQV